MGIVADSNVEITMKMFYGNVEQYNVWQYRVATFTGVPSAANIAEGWWNHVKSTYRALVTTGYGSVFQSVLIREMDSPTGDYAEYAVPTAERAGTRTDTAANTYATTFTAVGVRLSVGTRVTRPGQKRFGFITESDLNSNQIETAYLNLITSHMNVMAADMLLGSPAAGVVLRPYVIRKDPTGAVVTGQRVTGFIVNPFATSQVSRKLGRGI